MTSNIITTGKSQTSILYKIIYTDAGEGDIDHLQLMKVYLTLYDAYTGLLNTFYKSPGTTN
ncbi:MAG: hypothetical protein IPK62_08625 [Bacteroidetes bacterium]|nr:hypothetical protein [Bacteroidota bacterium]